MSKGQRVGKFIENLEAAKPATSAGDAIALINRTLDDVEDLYSGVPKNPDAINMSNITDGRMYGVLDDKFVRRFDDGGLVARTRNNVIEADPNGAFRIYARDRAAPRQMGLPVEKPGGR